MSGIGGGTGSDGPDDGGTCGGDPGTGGAGDEGSGSGSGDRANGDDGVESGDGRARAGGPGDVAVRPAAPGEADAVRRLLDAAVLTVPADLPARVADGDALVAVERDRDGGGESGTAGDAAPIGTLVLDGGHVEAVAVNRSRRAEGVGSALVRAAAARVDGELTARFRPQVRPFYESLGFAVREADPADPDSDRLVGRLPP